MPRATLSPSQTNLGARVFTDSRMHAATIPEMAVVRWQVLACWESRRGVQLTSPGHYCIVRMAEIFDILRSLVVGEKATQNAQAFLPVRESVPSGDEVNREFT
jgi:hypothetical protein